MENVGPDCGGKIVRLTIDPEKAREIEGFLRNAEISPEGPLRTTAIFLAQAIRLLVEALQTRPVADAVPAEKILAKRGE